MESQVTSWLNEGLRHYSAGDASRALEAWYRILEVEPDHPAALEYVSFVREALSAEPTPPAPATTPPAPVAAPRRDTVDDFHWADVVGPVTPSPPPPRVPEAVPLAEPAPVAAVVEAPTEPVVAVVVEAAVEPAAPVADSGADEGVDIDIDMAAPVDDEPPRLPTIIIEGMDDEPPSVPEPMVEIRPAQNGTGEISVAEIMPAPDPVSASRPIPRRPTPTPAPVPAPSPAFDFDALVRDTPTAPIEPPSLEPPPPPPIAVTPVAPAAPIVLVEVPRLRTPSAPLKVAPRTHTPTSPFERVIRQSIRFDEPRGVTMGPPPSPPLSASVSTELAAVAAPAAEAAPAPVPVEPAPVAVAVDEHASPWDDAVGPATPLDLDTSSRPPSAFDSLLRDATAAMVITERVEDEPEAPAPAPAPAPVDELAALMTGAKELFELGDFSGSLELVEKVLRRNAQHEGALAYLKRNEATLLRMYESKIGDMSRIPKPLVPPDEVIWMNMHHRAGFILSQVDGTLSYDDLLEISGMDRFDTVRIVADLVTAGIIG
jgi:hypothetical protein